MFAMMDEDGDGKLTPEEITRHFKGLEHALGRKLVFTSTSGARTAFLTPSSRAIAHTHSLSLSLSHEHTYIHVHTYTHIHTRTCIHTHIHARTAGINFVSSAAPLLNEIRCMGIFDASIPVL